MAEVRAAHAHTSICTQIQASEANFRLQLSIHAYKGSPDTFNVLKG